MLNHASHHFQPTVKYGAKKIKKIIVINNIYGSESNEKCIIILHI